MNNIKLVSENIKTLRKNYGLTQLEFAKKINVNRAMVGFYEQGNNTPTLNVLIKISDKFNITLDKLVRGIIARVDEPTSESGKLHLCNVSQQRKLLWAYHNYLLQNTDKNECLHTIDEFLKAHNSG